MKSRGRVLVVEDDLLIAREFRDILVAGGFEVPVTVTSGADALVAAGVRHPDLVVLDIGLQGAIDGIALAVALNGRRRTPVLFVTGAADPETMARAAAVGPFAYLIKPVNPRQLCATAGFAIRRVGLNHREAGHIAGTQDFRELFDATADGVLVTDAHGCIMLANQACGQLFGYAPADLINQPVEILMPGRARLAHVAAREAFAEHPQLRPMGERAELIGLRSDGTTFPVEVGLSPLGSGKSLRVIAIIRDATERRLAQRAVEENRELARQLHRVQKQDAVGRLAGGIAHDFNNLLMVIGGYAERLLDGEDAAPRRRHLVGLKETVDRAAALTRQLLAFSRRQVLQPEIVDLNRALEATERMLSRVIGEDIRMVIRPAHELYPVKVDPSQMEQVLLNLVVNARDAMPEGGSLGIETANVFLPEPFQVGSSAAFAPPGHYVSLTVRDTGIGMDAATVSKAFEPFFSTKDPAKGTGLGLSTVYGIVKQSGGYIWLESAPGAGATVTIMLPATGERPVEAAVNEPLGPVPRGHGRVLLVEDEEPVRELVAEFLTAAGFDVVTAGDGNEGLAVLKSTAAAFDLIVSDVVLPQTSGPAFIEAARLHYPHMKALLMSGYTDGHLPLHYQAEPHTRFLQKPFSREQLLRALAELLA
ncbi:MAG: response regulator [Vicinamibacterales bacterium]|jgi:hypothetical protein